MARCATIAPAQTEAAVLALDSANTACEGRMYPTSDTNKAYIGLADGSLLGPLPSDGGDGGGGTPWETATLEVIDEVTIEVTYQGTLPSLAKTADGVFEITVPSSTLLKGYYAISGDDITYTGSNTLRLRLVDGAGKKLYGVYTIHQKSTGEEAAEFVGVVERQTNPLAGTIQVEFPNMSNLAGGFIVIGAISI